MQKFFLILVLICVVSVVAQAQPTITSYSPARNTTASAQNADISLTWSTNMNFATLTSGNIIVRGSMTGQKYSTAAVFSNNGSNQITLNPTANFKPGELISVTVTGATSLGGVPSTQATSYSFCTATGFANGTMRAMNNVFVGSGLNPWPIVLADMNGDGILDFVVGSYTYAISPAVSVFLGNGSGGFTSASGTPMTLSGKPISMTIGDINGDGKLDVVIGNEGNTITALIGDGFGGLSVASGSPFVIGSGNRYSIALSDINSDGILDIVSANPGATDVSIFLGNGDGSFSEASGSPIELGVQPLGVTLGDLNGDGLLDLVTSNNSNSVSVLLGDGIGGFSQLSNYVGGGYSWSVTLGDVNGDGNLDIVTGGGYLFIGNGNGTFAPATGTGLGSETIALGDVNGDGKLDIVGSNGFVALGNGSGGFSALSGVPFPVGAYPKCVSLGDINGDGALDFVVANHYSSNVSVILGSPFSIIYPNGGETITPGTTATITWTSTATISHVNIEYSVNSGTTWTTIATSVVNTGSYSWTVPNIKTASALIRVSNSTNANSFDVSDSYFSITSLRILTYTPARNTPNSGIQQDISLEWNMPMSSATLTAQNIVVRGSQSGAQYSTSGIFSYPSTTTVTLSHSNFKPGELITVEAMTGIKSTSGEIIGHSNIYNFTAAAGLGTGNGLGTGVFSSIASVAVANNINSIAFGDFNGDGVLDLAAASLTGVVSIRLGDGSGGFSGSTEIPVGDDPANVELADFNGDGILDLAVSNWSGNAVSIRLGDGSGGFNGSTEIAVGPNPRAVAIGDFNGDGILDFATANEWSSIVSIRLGDGSGGFSTTTDVNVGNNPWSIAIGDFNSDGILDLAVANSQSNSVSIRLGDGTGHFFGTTEIAVGTTPIAVALGDFNGDGILDFVASNHNDGTTSIRLGDGMGGFSGSTTISLGTKPWSAVSVGDFNGDGKLDFATVNIYGSNVSICMGDGTGEFSNPTNFLVGNSPMSVALGDFNGDGILDFATGNWSTSGVSLYLGSANTPPTISAIHNMVLHAGTTNIVSFSISDAQTTAANLVVTATSSNLSFVASTGLTLSATSGNMTLGIIPTGNILSGQANITVSVSDGEYTTSATFTTEMDYKMQARKLIKLHPNESYTFTFTATDDQGHPYEGNVAVKDDVSSTQFSSHNFSNGTVSHTVTVPGGKAAGIYAVKFSADNLVDVEYVEVLP